MLKSNNYCFFIYYLQDYNTHLFFLWTSGCESDSDSDELLLSSEEDEEEEEEDELSDMMGVGLFRSIFSAKAARSGL